MNYKIYGVVVALISELKLDIPEIEFERDVILCHSKDVKCIVEIKNTNEYVLHLRKISTEQEFIDSVKQIADCLLKVKEFQNENKKD